MKQQKGRNITPEDAYSSQVCLEDPNALRSALSLPHRQ